MIRSRRIEDRANHGARWPANKVPGRTPEEIAAATTAAIIAPTRKLCGSNWRNADNSRHVNSQFCERRIILTIHTSTTIIPASGCIYKDTISMRGIFKTAARVALICLGVAAFGAMVVADEMYEEGQEAEMQQASDQPFSSPSAIDADPASDLSRN